MNYLQATLDKFAIGISTVCAIHCLFTPLLVLSIPAIAVLGIDGEWFHKLMVAVVIPTSLFSLTLGCKKHKVYQIFALGALGIVILIAALFFEANPTIEKVLTLAGASIIALSHYLNFKLCRAKKQKCECP